MSGEVTELKQKLADRIFAFDDLQIEEVEVPQWGGIRVQLRGMDGKTRARLMADATTDDDTINFERLYPDLIIACAYDPETGEPIFTDTQEHRDALNSKSGAALELLARKAMRVSGLDREAQEEAARNLSSIPKSSTSSDSPNGSGAQ